jgi:hypothetical protein
VFLPQSERHKFRTLKGKEFEFKVSENKWSGKKMKWSVRILHNGNIFIYTGHVVLWETWLQGSRWKGYIKMYIRKIVRVDLYWIELAQYRN